MVAQKTKSLIIEELAKPSDHQATRVFSVLWRPLRFLIRSVLFVLDTN